MLAQQINDKKTNINRCPNSLHANAPEHVQLAIIRPYKDTNAFDSPAMPPNRRCQCAPAPASFYLVANRTPSASTAAALAAAAAREMRRAFGLAEPSL